MWNQEPNWYDGRTRWWQSNTTLAWGVLAVLSWAILAWTWPRFIIGATFAITLLGICLRAILSFPELGENTSYGGKRGRYTHPVTVADQQERHTLRLERKTVDNEVQPIDALAVPGAVQDCITPGCNGKMQAIKMTMTGKLFWRCTMCKSRINSMEGASETIVTPMVTMGATSED